MEEFLEKVEGGCTHSESIRETFDSGCGELALGLFSPQCESQHAEEKLLGCSSIPPGKPRLRPQLISWKTLLLDLQDGSAGKSACYHT